MQNTRACFSIINARITCIRAIYLRNAPFSHMHEGNEHESMPVFGCTHSCSSSMDVHSSRGARVGEIRVGDG